MTDAQRIRYVVYAQVGDGLIAQGEAVEEAHAVAAAQRMLACGKTGRVKVDRRFTDPIQNRTVDVAVFEETANPSAVGGTRRMPLPIVLSLVGFALAAGVATYWLTRTVL